MGSIEYYERNADQFFDRTAHVKIPHLWAPFMELIPAKGKILDIGCGSGRDSLYFSQRGYEVVAMDPSPAMRERASRLTGIPVLDSSFERFEGHEEFDGIWACAALLHVTKQAMPGVISRLALALKRGGALYVSYKLRDEEWEEDDRHFTGYDSESLSELLLSDAHLRLVRIWETEDVGRKGLLWVNALAIRSNPTHRKSR